MMVEIADARRAFEERIGYRFSNPRLLEGALTHPSAAGAAKRVRDGAGYERLEFLGDRVLGLVVAELLLERFVKEDEGAIAKRHTALVRKETLLEVAGRIELLSAMERAPGEGRAQRRQLETAAADGVEALIGAIFIDGGFAAARGFVRAWWTAMLDQYSAPPKDPKTTLQEWAQSLGLPLPVYRVLASDGPDHQPTFVVAAEVADRLPTHGRGRSKRAAEQAAATAMLEAIKAEAET